MPYIYPPTRFVRNGLLEQVNHLLSEAKEVAAAYSTPDIQHLAEELCDVIHSAETGLRILADRYDVDVRITQAAVVRKNQERGYYA